MNPVILQLIKWVLEKALIEAGKEINWESLKSDVDAKLDSMLPGSVYDKVAKYLINLLLGFVQGSFMGASIPVTPDTIHQAVENANKSLLGRVASDFLTLKV